MTTLDTLLDSRQLADYLGCTTATIERLRSEGRGPRYCRVGRMVRYRGRDIADYLDNYTVDTEGREQVKVRR